MNGTDREDEFFRFLLETGILFGEEEEDGSEDDFFDNDDEDIDDEDSE